VEEQQRAVAEVDKIAELFLEDRDETAVQYRNELVERQANHSDHSHLVKSLCHIASKCSDGGRNDAAFECLNVALQYENGVDSRLFVQLGNLFKDLRRFENATECFRNALRSADSSSDRDLINRELARLLVARGEYPEALRAFRELSDIDVAPESRTSLATLHRKMGHFADARRIYNDVWSNYRSHQAFSGLAEVNRQSGRIDKAIRKYRFLLQRPEIESRSRKVYTMALSSLLCTSGSLDAAENVLQPLLQTHRNDASVQLAMAKIFRLRGDLKQADTLYESARFRIEETERWASQLYETARMAVCTANEIRTVEQPGPCVSLPEYQTLSECNSLLRRILRRDWDGYQPPAAPSTGPFKIHSDFSSVLRYHTKLLIGGPFSLIDQHRVNRIRRRGLVPLRAAVRALDSSDFDAAIQYECEMCLKAA
jgi:tetratricopeptide (TPR) repeat protein